jgi:DNA modification methylase
MATAPDSRPYRLDPYFHLPQPAAENRAELKRLMIEAGRCIAPIIYWKEEGILLDGYTRLQIIDEIRENGQPDFPDPEARPMSFKTRVAAKQWALRHQIGRRAGFDNFTLIDTFAADETLMRSITAPAKHRMLAGKKSSDPVPASEQGRTVEVIAKRLHVGKQTVHEALAVRRFPRVVAAVRSGQITAHQAYSSIRSNVRRQQQNNRVASNHRRIPTYEGNGLLNGIHLIDVLEGLRQLQPASVDLIFTSPPYPLSAVEYPTPTPFYTGDYAAYLEKMNTIWRECRRILKPGARLIVNFDNVNIPPNEREGEEVRRDLRRDFANQLDGLDFVFTDEYVWAKQNAVGLRPAMGTKGSPVLPRCNNNTEYVCVWSNQKLRIEPMSDELNDLTDTEHFKWSMQLWEIPPQTRPADGKGHRCAFPTELARRIIKLYSYRSQVVLDPFSGSGTTCAVAAELGRQYIGFDAAAKYVASARKRVAAAIKQARSLADNPPKPIKADPPTLKSIMNQAKFATLHRLARQSKRKAKKK